MSDSVRPHRCQPTRLPHLWDSPDKNTGVGCHFLLQCMKVKSESEVAQSCLTPSDPMDCSLPGSSVHRISQARVLEWGAIAFSLMDSRHPETDMVLGMASLCSWGNPWRRLLTASTSLKGAWWHNIMSTVQSKFPMTAHVQIEPWWLFTRKPEEKSLHWDQLLVFFKTPSFQLYFFYVTKNQNDLT